MRVRCQRPRRLAFSLPPTEGGMRRTTRRFGVLASLSEPHRPPMATTWQSRHHPLAHHPHPDPARFGPEVCCSPAAGARCPPAPAMGSLGWDQCYWCGWWEENMYIPDGIDNPLCEYCLAHRRGPPQPDARRRLYDVLQRILPARVAWEIAEFTHWWHEPWHPRAALCSWK